MPTRRHKRTKKNTTKKNNSVFFYKTVPKLININNVYLLLLPLKNSHATQMECTIFGGNFLEKNKTSGIAHLLEHLLISASKYCGSMNCVSYLDNYGIQYNASTSSMFTNYWLKGLSEYNNIMLNYITSIIFSPIITNQLIKKEKEAVRNELNSYINDPSWKLTYLMRKAFYKVVGLKNDSNYALQLKLLEQINTKDLFQHIEEIITKRCILFTISGNFNKKNIINHFKKITVPHKHKICALEKKMLPNSCYTFAKKIIFVKNNKAKNTNISVAFPIDIKQGDKYGIYLGFLSSILGGDLNSILLKRLREELKLVYGLKVSTETNLCGSVLYINTSTEDKNVKRVLYEIFNLIRFYLINPVPQNKIKNEKLKYKLALNQLCTTNPGAVSVFYTHQYFWQMNKKARKIWTIKDVANNIEKLSLNTINTLMKKIFDTDKCIVGYIGKKNMNISFKDF
jgi:predicted Zn-dependent peptidase